MKTTSINFRNLLNVTKADRREDTNGVFEKAERKRNRKTFGTETTTKKRKLSSPTRKMEQIRDMMVEIERFHHSTERNDYDILKRLISLDVDQLAIVVKTVEIEYPDLKLYHHQTRDGLDGNLIMDMIRTSQVEKLEIVLNIVHSRYFCYSSAAEHTEQDLGVPDPISGVMIMDQEDDTTTEEENDTILSVQEHKDIKCLWMAIYKGNVDICRLLLKHMECIPIPQNESECPLHMAATLSRFSVFEVLCKHVEPDMIPLDVSDNFPDKSLAIEKGMMENVPFACRKYALWSYLIGVGDFTGDNILDVEKIRENPSKVFSNQLDNGVHSPKSSPHDIYQIGLVMKGEDGVGPGVAREISYLLKEYVDKNHNNLFENDTIGEKVNYFPKNAKDREKCSKNDTCTSNLGSWCSFLGYHHACPSFNIPLPVFSSFYFIENVKTLLDGTPTWKTLEYLDAGQLDYCNWIDSQTEKQLFSMDVFFDEPFHPGCLHYCDGDGDDRQPTKSNFLFQRAKCCHLCGVNRSAQAHSFFKAFFSFVPDAKILCKLFVPSELHKLFSTRDATHKTTSLRLTKNALVYVKYNQKDKATPSDNGEYVGYPQCKCCCLGNSSISLLSEGNCRSDYDHGSLFDERCLSRRLEVLKELHSLSEDKVGLILRFATGSDTISHSDHVGIKIRFVDRYAYPSAITCTKTLLLSVKWSLEDSFSVIFDSMKTSDGDFNLE